MVKYQLCKNASFLMIECAVQEAAHAKKLLQELAGHTAAAVYAKQVPIEDLLGITISAVREFDIVDDCMIFVKVDGPVRITGLDGDRLDAFSRLVLESYMDADGASEPPCAARNHLA